MRVRNVSAASLAIVIATAVALALRGYELTRPGELFGFPQYDDGEYLGSAIRLADGVVPYRDFVFVQPPGITVLMAPLGLLAKLTGTATSMVIARVLTALVGSTSVVLGGLLVRHRGAVAVTIVCGILAVHPEAVGASSTLFLEPWLVLFCLLGCLAAFEGDRLSPSRRRLLWAGVAFGVAGAVKVWAIFPVLVLTTMLLLEAPRRRAADYLGGVFAGFGVLVLPFVVLAPQAVFDDVIVAQLRRVDVTRAPASGRLSTLLGIHVLSPSGRAILAATVLVATLGIVSVALGSLLCRSLPPALDRFSFCSAVLVAVAFAVPPDYYAHYAAFFAPFLALSIALAIARLVQSLSLRLAAGGGDGRVQAPLTPLVGVGAAIGLIWMAAKTFEQEKTLYAFKPAPAIIRAIPPGACVLTDVSAFTILANRFRSDAPDCPQIVDAIATDMGLSHGSNALTGAGRSPAVQAAWLNAFRHAKYIWLNCGPPGAPGCNRSTNRRITWTQPIVEYFSTHFRYLPGVGIYVRTR